MGSGVSILLNSTNATLRYVPLYFGVPEYLSLEPSLEYIVNLAIPYSSTSLPSFRTMDVIGSLALNLTVKTALDQLFLLTN